MFRFSIDAEAWNARQAPVKPRARERSREVSSAFGTRARGANALALVEVSANDALDARAREGVARESGGATHVNGGRAARSAAMMSARRTMRRERAKRCDARAGARVKWK